MSGWMAVGYSAAVAAFITAAYRWWRACAMERRARLAIAKTRVYRREVRRLNLRAARQAERIRLLESEAKLRSVGVTIDGSVVAELVARRG